ncbi:unnamed protein product, partial [marine sediment metagenome]
PRTWFNQCVKNAIDQYKNGDNAFYARDGTLTPAATSIKLRMLGSGHPASPTKYDIVWGTSKTALINTQSISQADLSGGKDITGMPKSTKIFLQVRPSDPPACVGSRSGIYYAKTTA